MNEYTARKLLAALASGHVRMTDDDSIRFEHPVTGETGRLSVYELTGGPRSTETDQGG